VRSVRARCARSSTGSLGRRSPSLQPSPQVRLLRFPLHRAVLNNVLHMGAHDPRKNTATLVDEYERAFPVGEVTLAFTRRPPALPRGGIIVEVPDDASLIALYRGAAPVALRTVPVLPETARNGRG
jgi:hypothetical protein